MKKILITIISLFTFSFCFSQSRDTTVVQDGNALVIRVNDDGTYTGVTYNRQPVNDDANRSAALCAAVKKQKCCADVYGCGAYCCGVPSCEIAWLAACLFDWFRQN